MTYELLTQNGNNVYQPLVQNGVQWTTERKGTPSKLTFSVFQDDVLKINEGNPVRFKVNGVNVFYGFVFTKKTSKERLIDITCFDQIRYLQNKDTYVFNNITASNILRRIANDFSLKLGTVEETEFIIKSKVEDNSSLIDMIGNALDDELTNKKRMYVLYDDFGALCLKELERMKVGILIDEETGSNYDYTSSIDNDSYNKIKLVRENEDTGMRDVYIAQDSSNINEWGILQYFDTLKENENGQAKADALLSLYNNKTRKLKISKALGDVRVRGGSMPVVNLNLGDISVKNHMMVEKAVHEFNNDEHFMDLTLRGGEFIG